MIGRWLADRRRRELLEESTPEAIELMVVAGRAGLAPSRMLSAVAEVSSGPVAEILTRSATEIEQGRRVSDVLDDLLERAGPGLGSVAPVLGGALRDGAPTTAALERLAAEARDMRRRRLEARVRRLPVLMLGPLVLCFLPATVVVVVVPPVAAALDQLRL